MAPDPEEPLTAAPPDAAASRNPALRWGLAAGALAVGAAAPLTVFGLWDDLVYAVHEPGWLLDTGAWVALLLAGLVALALGVAWRLRPGGAAPPALLAVPAVLLAASGPAALAWLAAPGVQRELVLERLRGHNALRYVAARPLTGPLVLEEPDLFERFAAEPLELDWEKGHEVDDAARQAWLLYAGWELAGREPRALLEAEVGRRAVLALLVAEARPPDGYDLERLAWLDALRPREPTGGFRLGVLDPDVAAGLAAALATREDASRAELELLVATLTLHPTLLEPAAAEAVLDRWTAAAPEAYRPYLAGARRFRTRIAERLVDVPRGEAVGVDVRIQRRVVGPFGSLPVPEGEEDPTALWVDEVREHVRRLVASTGHPTREGDDLVVRVALRAVDQGQATHARKVAAGTHTETTTRYDAVQKRFRTESETVTDHETVLETYTDWGYRLRVRLGEGPEETHLDDVLRDGDPERDDPDELEIAMVLPWWLKDHEPEVYEALPEAWQRSRTWVLGLDWTVASRAAE